ncbi:hypothetical protein TWF506_008088 [Arthrobotrys conoides]|uniref:Uncharacterized protein n=1 Tax=Arthrobotrys conoides TaxID=74498 RepID=A0AAN8RRP3_9PEZI
MPFVPELVSTTRYSNRTAGASALSTSDNRPSDAAGTPASKPRFLPEPIETTRRTNRAVPSIETSVSGSNSPPSSNSSTPKASLQSNNTEQVSQASASRFLPEPVETTRRSNRTQPVKPADNTDVKRKGWGRDSCDDYADKEEHKPVILNRAHRIPVPIPGPGKSKWFPDEDLGWGQQYNKPAIKNAQPANGTFEGANRSFLPLSSPSPQPMTAASGHGSHANANDVETYFQSLPDSTFELEEAISSQVRDQSNYRNNGDPRQFNHSTNETSSIAGILGSTAASSNPANANSPTTVRSGDEHQEEVAGTASLSCSPASSLKSNASGPNYLLDSSTSQQQQHSTGLTVAVPVITSTEYLSPSSCEEAPSGLKRPVSPNAILVRDFGYTSSRPTLLKLPKADASACSLPGVVPKVQQIQVQHNGPHTNINTGSYPQSGLLDPSTYTTTSSTSSTFTKHSAVDLLRNQVLAAQSQLIRDKQSFLSPTYTLNNKPLQPLNGSDEPKRKKPLLPFSFIPAASRSVNTTYLSPGSPYQRVLLTPGTPVTPLLCESPMPTTLFYESSKMSSHGDYFTAKKQASGMSIASNADSIVSRDTALTTPSTRPSSPGPSKYGYPCTSTSSLVAMVCQTPQPICSDPPNMCPETKEDVSTEFVVAVFNYLSLGHESIARKFDKELCEATGWGLERVTTDRLGALREYVEEYVDRKPRFGSGMAGW